MDRKTIAQVAVEVLKAGKKPMTAEEITVAILDQGLFPFNSKTPKSMVSSAIERRCEGSKRKDTLPNKLFIKTADRKYWLQSNP